MRVVDLLVVAKDENGAWSTRSRTTDVAELTELGAVAGALMGFGAAGEEGMEVGALAGAEAALEEGSMYDDADVWYIADTIPPGMTAVVAVLEHHWAIPLRNAIRRAGGVPLADSWIYARGPHRSRNQAAAE